MLIILFARIFRTKWASPLQLPLPLNFEGLEHFARRRNTAKR